MRQSNKVQLCEKDEIVLKKYTKSKAIAQRIQLRAHQCTTSQASLGLLTSPSSHS